MSVQTGRMVSADEARKAIVCAPLLPEPGPEVVRDLAHTVVTQAEQIAAARALAERWQNVAAEIDESRLTPTVAAIFGTQAGCGDAILKALGVSGELKRPESTHVPVCPYCHGYTCPANGCNNGEVR